MLRFIKKIVGNSKGDSESTNPEEISHDDITAWMVGEANEATRSAIAKELEDPKSPTTRHLAWLADPDKHQQGEVNESAPSAPPTKETIGPERFIGSGESQGNVRDR